MGEEGLIDLRKFNTGVRKATLAEDNAIIAEMVQNPFQSSDRRYRISRFASMSQYCAKTFTGKPATTVAGLHVKCC